MYTRFIVQCRLTSCNSQALLNIKHFSTSSCRLQTHYDTLGVNRLATKNKIKHTYFELSKKYHPDLSAEPDATEKFTKITRAYAVLGNEESRKAYDKQLIEEREAAVRRRLQEVRNLFLARRQEREKSEAGKAHPTTKTAINVGRWAYVMQEKRMKGDYTWENPRRYKEGKQTTTQAKSSNTASTSASSSSSSATTSSDPSQRSQKSQQTSKSEDAEATDQDVRLSLVPSILFELVKGAAIVGIVIFVVPGAVMDAYRKVRSDLDDWKKNLESEEQD